MKTRIIFMLFITLFTFTGIVNSKADIVRKVKTSSSKTIAGPKHHHIARVYHQGRHRWHRMHKRQVHERVHRHHMRHEHHRETRHYRHR